MKRNYLLIFILLLSLFAGAQSHNVWINEIHYDNQGTDTLEGFEIAGTAGIDLQCYEVALYNGISGQTYHVDTLSGVIPNQGCGIGAIWFALPQDSMLNGSAGIALAYAPTATGCGGPGNDTVLQFISYGGTFTATNGIAQGLNSVYLNVSENSSTIVGTSLQLGGTGIRYSDFNWQSSLNATPGAVNVNQNFCATRIVYITPDSISLSEAAGTTNISVTLTNPSPVNVTVAVQLVTSATTATQNSDFIFNDTTLTWPAFTSGTYLLPVQIIDDTTQEPNETVQFKVTNVPAGILLGDSTSTLTIIDNDGPPPTPAVINFVATTDSVIEDTLVINVVVRVDNPGPGNAGFTVQRDDAVSTATNGLDYIFVNQVFTNNQNPPGTTFDTIQIYLYDDALIEPTETVLLKFSNLGSNVVKGPDSTFVLSILDTDKLYVSFLGAGFSYVENAGQVPLKIIRSTPSLDTVSVHISLAAGNATRGLDFLFNDTTVVFPSSMVDSLDTISVWVTILDDHIYEGNEQANFDLSNATNVAGIRITGFTLTIIDNDSATGISPIEFDGHIKVYPNPVHQSLSLQTEDLLDEVWITDLWGNMVYKAGGVNPGRSVIDVSSLSAGMYFINVKSGANALTRKFIKTD